MVIKMTQDSITKGDKKRYVLYGTGYEGEKFIYSNLGYSEDFFFVKYLSNEYDAKSIPRPIQFMIFSAE